MDISIVIVSYNVKEYIVSCVESIYKHSKSNYTFEIIIVDNNSKDGSAEELIKEFPKIPLIKNNYNPGFSIAVNQGVKKSRGDYLLILNPDTLFVEDSLYILLKEAESKKRLGAIGPSLIDEKGLIQQSFWRSPSLLSTILSIFYLDYFNYYKNYKEKKFNKISKVDSISGGAFFLQKKIFNELDGFDEDLFWMEDIDFCLNARKKGYNIFYSPRTKIIHFSGKSSESNFKVTVSNQLKSKIKFFRKNHSKLKAIILLYSIIFLLIIKSFVALIFSLYSKFYRKKLLAYIFSIRFILLDKNLINSK